MKTINDSLLDMSYTIESRLIEWRRHMHMYPELSQHEVNTSRYIVEQLGTLGIDARVVNEMRAVVGVIKGEGGAEDADIGTRCLRADMDALPIREATGAEYASRVDGVMHACGHDAHVAIQLGAAALLIKTRDKWCGEVRLLFEPAEETVGGAKRIAADGYLNGAEALFALHMHPGLKVGQLWSRVGAMSGFSDELLITIKGRNSHGAYPERGVDAIIIAANVLLALQTIISRNTSAFDNAVLSFGMINGGTAGNILADEVRVKGTLRATDGGVREASLAKLREICNGVSKAYGGDCEIRIIPGCDAVICDTGLVGAIQTISAGIGMEYLTKPTPSLGVDSFGDMCAHAPGLYYDLGCAISENAPPLHTPEFDIDERCLRLGAYLQAALCLYKP